MKLNKIELLGVVFLTLVIGFTAGLTSTEPRNTPGESTDNVLSEGQTHLVAVDREGNGVITDLSVKTIPGNGRILVDIENLLFFLDTQQSIQTAKDVAERYLNTNLGNRDIVYNIEIDNSSVVGGESAGGALTVATIAALSGKPLRDDTIMTGTIDAEGNVGPIGGLLAKAQAAHNAGFTYFLVPKGQGTYVDYAKQQKCAPAGRTMVCATEFKPIRIDISKEAGIHVIEVANVEDAVRYFIPNFDDDNHPRNVTRLA
ncbi:MAG: hypothetical protein HY366_03090 [Candidatus Aenigmarchaeota archaeon]|nr:hypothetical protein [Candidatus Aenigmarchaeota archaeon]